MVASVAALPTEPVANPKLLVSAIDSHTHLEGLSEKTKLSLLKGNQPSYEKQFNKKNYGLYDYKETLENNQLNFESQKQEISYTGAVEPCNDDLIPAIQGLKKPIKRPNIRSQNSFNQYPVQQFLADEVAYDDDFKIDNDEITEIENVQEVNQEDDIKRRPNRRRPNRRRPNRRPNRPRIETFDDSYEEYELQQPLTHIEGPKITYVQQGLLEKYESLNEDDETKRRRRPNRRRPNRRRPNRRRPNRRRPNRRPNRPRNEEDAKFEQECDEYDGAPLTYIEGPKVAYLNEGTYDIDEFDDQYYEYDEENYNEEDETKRRRRPNRRPNKRPRTEELASLELKPISVDEPFPLPPFFNQKPLDLPTVSAFGGGRIEQINYAPQLQKIETPKYQSFEYVNQRPDIIPTPIAEDFIVEPVVQEKTLELNIPVQHIVRSEPLQNFQPNVVFDKQPIFYPTVVSAAKFIEKDC